MVKIVMGEIGQSKAWAFFGPNSWKYPVSLVSECAIHEDQQANMGTICTVWRLTVEVVVWIHQASVPRFWAFGVQNAFPESHPVTK
jgi:hypothetical protein